MKRLVAVLAGLVILPAFAEVVPDYYYLDAVEYTDDEDVNQDVVNDADGTENESDSVAVPVVNSTRRATPGRAVSTRGVTPGRATTSRRASGTSTRTVTSRATVAPTRASASRATVTRVAAPVTNTVNANAGPVAARAATDVSGRAVAPRATTARASIVQNDTVNTPLYTGRAASRSVGTRMSTRAPAIRMATATTTASSTSVTTETVADAAAEMDALAEMTDYCKAQYVSCMDNFCNVLDDNQGRCSCSPNIKNYEKTENALKQASEDLQDVAQKIQYIGLSSDEVETLFTQTAAELEMQSNIDNSQIKNDLDKIKNMIVDVKRGNATVSDSGVSVDLSGLLDFNISSSGFDLSSLMGNSTTTTSSISNQRGEQLYKTAAARCKSTILNSCSAQGVDTAVIVNAYDMEIDKQCVAYERALTDANDQMVSTVRNAKSVLQKARLLVAQQKNSYDLRGCINALDSCMQDEFVCGTDYENCLDPSGRYIVNGEIVVGSTPGSVGCYESDNSVCTGGMSAIYGAWESVTGNIMAWGNGSGDTLANYVSNSMMGNPSEDFVKPTNNIAMMLQQKIGYHDDTDGRDYGMCMSVLNKCQRYTYTGAGQNQAYNSKNDVVKEYLNRVLVQIKTKQEQLINDYAEDCASDVTSCLSENNFDTSKEGSNTIVSDMTNKLAVRACTSLIKTCMSVNGVQGSASATTMNADQWILSIMGKTVSE